MPNNWRILFPASPVAAASIGQVHSGTLPNKQKVAIKVQRPGIRETVEEDTKLLRTIVRLVESIPAIPRLQKGQDRLISTDLSGAVEELVSRIFEEQRIRGNTRGTNTGTLKPLRGDHSCVLACCVAAPFVLLSFLASGCRVAATVVVAAAVLVACAGVGVAVAPAVS